MYITNEEKSNKKNDTFNLPSFSTQNLRWLANVCSTVAAMSHLPHFITPILKSLVVPVIWLALIVRFIHESHNFFALNHIFSPANEEVTLKKNSQSDFQACSKWPIKLQENETQRVSCGEFCNFCFQNSNSPPPHPPSAPKKVEFSFKQTQYCINKIFELTKSCIWAISKWM